MISTAILFSTLLMLLLKTKLHITHKVLFQGAHNGLLYKLVSSSPLLSLHSTQVFFDLWHQRLEHLHESIVCQVISKNKLPFSSLKFHKCSSCILGKARHTHLASLYSKSFFLLELIHNDVSRSYCFL